LVLSPAAGVGDDGAAATSEAGDGVGIGEGASTLSTADGGDGSAPVVAFNAESNASISLWDNVSTIF